MIVTDGCRVLQLSLLFSYYYYGRQMGHCYCCVRQLLFLCSRWAPCITSSIQLLPLLVCRAPALVIMMIMIRTIMTMIQNNYS